MQIVRNINRKTQMQIVTKMLVLHRKLSPAAARLTFCAKHSLILGFSDRKHVSFKPNS